jgi:hypothetical protein
MIMQAHRSVAVLGAGLLAAAMLLAVPTAAFATGTGTTVPVAATAVFTGGALTFTGPAVPAFTATLAGVDQTVTQPQVFEVSDATGSGLGWNITATSTFFTTSAPIHTLAIGSVTEQAAPVAACDATVACTVATTGLTYPYTLPSGASAPTATKMVSAAVNTGMGNQSSTNTMRLAVPAATFSGSYSSTWTYSLVSAP